MNYRLPGLSLVAAPAALAMLLADSAAAQDAEATQDAEPETIIVTGSRTRLAPEQIGSATTVITRAQIETEQARFVKDILQDVPGVQVSNDRPGAVTSVYLRGADNDQVLVMLDGVEVGDPSNISTQFQFDHMGTADIERIEIVRGNQSSLYGSDAIGGVINIITRRPPAEGVDLRLNAEAGSYGSQQLDATVAGSSGIVDYRLGASAFSADGPSVADPTAGPADEDDAYDRLGISGQAGIRIASGLRADVRVAHSDTDTELDGTGQDATFAPGVAKQDDVLTLSLAHESRDSRWHNELSLSRYEAERVYQPMTDLLVGTKENFRISSAAELSGMLSIAFGLDLEQEDTDQLTGFSGSFLAENDTGSVFAEAALSPLDRLTLTIASRRDDNDRFGQFGTHRLTAAWSLAPGTISTKLRASLGTGAKAPGLYQLFDPSFGNPDLGVEESAGFDVGADLVWRGGASLSVSYFSTGVENDIEFQFPAGYLNYGATRAHGVETYAAVPISSSVSWSFTHTWIDSWDRGTEQWLGRPRHSATTRFSFAATDRLDLTGRARYRSENAASFGGVTDSFVVVDLLASFELKRGLEVYGRIVNLFDADYQYEWGSSTYDRSAFAGVRMRY